VEEKEEPPRVPLRHADLENLEGLLETSYRKTDPGQGSAQRLGRQPRAHLREHVAKVLRIRAELQGPHDVLVHLLLGVHAKLNGCMHRGHLEGAEAGQQQVPDSFCEQAEQPRSPGSILLVHLGPAATAKAPDVFGGRR
jgi:hypothetical protein